MSGAPGNTTLDLRWAASGAPEPDPREQPLDLVLTPSEQSQIASFKCALEANRRQQNERDKRTSNPTRLHPVMAAALAPFAPTERAA